MNKAVWLTIGAAALGLGAASCSDIVGCFNPTGYCGDNRPDPNRIGGPSWFLSTGADERMSYYRDRCATVRPSFTTNEVTACAVQEIAQNAHQYCVLYHKPPIRPKDDAEAAERERNYEQCRTGVLVQHGI